ncbi:MAG: hypothetical protein NUV54_03020, partial [Candidatus Taylorbacteria bacterium]|nr:hypothetical protein [Candidatus Taylorbacteria bacterium]
MNNVLDLTKEFNQLFIASVICVLCERESIEIDLQDIEKYWLGGVSRLQYDMKADLQGKSGTIT